MKCCYYCGNIKPDSTESMNLTGYCEKLCKIVYLEFDLCKEFIQDWNSSVNASSKEGLGVDFVKSSTEEENLYE